MPLKYKEVGVEDILDLPGRIGDPDRWEVTRKYGNRIILNSMVHRENSKHMTDNQFDEAEFERAYDMPGKMVTKASMREADEEAVFLAELEEEDGV